MKKITVLFLTVVLCLTLCACGQKVETITLKESKVSIRVEDTYKLDCDILPADIENPKLRWSSSNDNIVTVDESGNLTAIAEGTAEITVSSGKVSSVCTVTVGKKVSNETDYTKIEGLYLDKSYENTDNKNIKLLYVFYTVTTPSDNLKIDSKSTKLTFSGTNTYEAEHIPGSGKYVKNYYYSTYLEEVFKGDKVKLVETYKVPMSELDEGIVITFENHQIPQTENLSVLTDDIVICNNTKEIAKKADPDGYKTETENMKKASDKKTSKVRNNINNYEWSFYVNYTAYKLVFYAPNIFQLRTAFNTVEGTYTVRNGYITLNYPSGYKVDVPYEFEGEIIKLDAASAFSVMEG